MWAILVAAISATLLLLLQAALLPSRPGLRRQLALGLELTALALLAGLGVVTVATVVTDMVTGRRATVQAVEMTVTVADMAATDTALAAMVRDVAAMDRATGTATPAIRATEAATTTDRVRAPATVVRTTGTAATAVAATGMEEAAVVKP